MYGFTIAIVVTDIAFDSKSSASFGTGIIPYSTPEASIVERLSASTIVYISFPSANCDTHDCNDELYLSIA